MSEKQFEAILSRIWLGHTQANTLDVQNGIIAARELAHARVEAEEVAAAALCEALDRWDNNNDENQERMSWHTVADLMERWRELRRKRVP